MRNMAGKEMISSFALTSAKFTVAFGLRVFTVALSGLFIVARFEVLAGERSSHCSVVFSEKVVTIN